MAHTTTRVLALGLIALLLGCSGGKKDRGVPAGSTSAPVTSGGGTTPTNPPPAPNYVDEALVSSFATDEVIEVDTKTGAVGNRWAVGDGPTDVAHDVTLSYVANALDQNVAVIDRLANNTAGSIDVLAQPVAGTSLLGFADPILKPLVRPTGVAVTPNGNTVVSANLLNVSVADAATLGVRKNILGLTPISLANLLANPSQAISTFLAAPVRGLGFAKVAATNDRAFVTAMLTGTVLRIDLTTNTVLGYTDVGKGPIGITIANGKAYVACALSQEVSVIDVATGNVLKTLAAGMVPVDCGTNKAQSAVYVANAISGDITVIDTAADLVVDTLPAGLSIVSMFQMMGIQVPTGNGSTGIAALLNGFLQGFAAGINNPNSFGNLLFNNQGGLLSPGTLINGLISGFLSYAGVTQSQLAGLNMPGMGLLSIAGAHDPDLVVSGNAFLGEVVLTRRQSKAVNTLPGLTGLGPVDVAPVVPR
ncbi:MAG: hypothetical protein D6731_25270 [Planctomycetota bacterium]|nr:MAG: hypothetical protein D6731_25270 [Planctomycetota bacterium]